MSDESNSLVLAYLRPLDEKVDRVSGDMQDLKARVAGVEEGLAGVHRRMDRFEPRLDGIEKRLDLTEAQR